MSCLLNLPTCILLAIPWWVWLILGLIALGLIWKFFGWKWVPAAAGVLLVLLFGDRALKAGYQQRKREEDAQQDKADSTVAQAQQQATADSDAELGKKVDKWTKH